MTFAIPPDGVFDSPSVCVSVNQTWVGYVLGVLEKLNRDSTWQGDDNAVYDVRQQVEALMEAFANGSEVCMVPIGAVLPFFAGAVPTNYLPCDGTEVNKSDYPDLYELLSGYVTEPTEETFNVPDFRLRMLMGSGIESEGSFSLPLLSEAGALRHTLTTGELPSHTHSIPAHTHSQNPHSHSVIDPGHIHQVATRSASGFGAQAWLTNSNNSGSLESTNIGSATTGISLGNATPTINAAPATNTGAAGSGTPFYMLPPVVGVNYIIRAK